MNVCSAVRSALVSWYSEMRGRRRRRREREREKREEVERRGGGGLFYIIQLSGASILIRANPY